MKTNEWFIFALCSLVMWGLWGFFQKLATNHIGPKNVYVFAGIGPIIVVLFVLLSLHFRVQVNREGIVYALFAGLAGSLGGLFFVHSVSRGKASIVITLTALYPVVTILLSLIMLKEQLTIKQGIGIILALISMVLLAV
jgi:transporter family protein